MSKIYELSTLYKLSKKYVVWVFKRYYDEYIILGKENIPVNEPLIIAPNHLNALMDAIAILSLPPSDKVKIFLARADIFNLHKLVVKFIRFAKLMPAFRIRDGYENLEKNRASFLEAEEALQNNAAVVIMAEGNQGEEKNIRPLVKGIFRIAFNAQQHMPVDKTVKILPVGIDMGHPVKFGKHIIINIGKAIDVNEYMPLYETNPANGINQLRNRLKDDMESLVQNLATEKYYPCFVTAIDAARHDMLIKLHYTDTTVNRFYTEQKIAKLLVELEKDTPQKIEELDILCKTYHEGLQRVNLRSENLDQSKPRISTFLLSFLWDIVCLCAALPGFILNILPFKIPTLFVKILKIEYHGFYSSVYYGFSIISFPLMYSTQSILLIALLSLPWWMFFILIPFHYFSGKLSFMLYKRIKLDCAKRRLYKFINTKGDEYHRLKTLKKQISEIVLEQLKR
ncbi:MAG: 1-acyl-sn-glycerol-3-phosphate acyltransferase [Paludibacter sp.]|nr:1-acyl-sn-glycerol-3-phosphate acyltransferase [Paludibacter sp.]